MTISQTSQTALTGRCSDVNPAAAATGASEADRRPRRPSWSPYRSALRWPAAAAMLVAGVVHVPPVPEHLSEAPYVGGLFIGLAVACAGLACQLIWRDTRAVWRLAAATTGATVVGYVASRTVGLPQMGDDVGNWSDPLGTIAVAAELATVALVSVALRRRYHP